ncbi:MAG TPA: hypothetical protein PKM32_04985 [Planctomycetota bacterium]|nr:hypothetical protein [Planctomycetota bacterium]HPY74922.1 hypothetical protein [Planctomycetota bacterium]HQB00614.1 hypothetical protein [Planctomycetota bacterium]
MKKIYLKKTKVRILSDNEENNTLNKNTDLESPEPFLQINLNEIKKLKGEELYKKIEIIQEERLRLFQEYSKLEEIIDDYQEKIDKICDEICKYNITLKEFGYL